MDYEKIRQATKLFLEGIGENPNREGLVETPNRVARMCDEIFAGYEDDEKVHLSKTFTSEHTGLVVEKDIEFYSVCEHHLLPFFGTVSIGYIPNGKVVGLSKLARCVDTFAKRAQIQEQMTMQIAEAIEKVLEPKGVVVYIEAKHMCMSMRGVKKRDAVTTTIAARGALEDSQLKSEFLRLIGK